MGINKRKNVILNSIRLPLDRSVSGDAEFSCNLVERSHGDLCRPKCKKKKNPGTFQRRERAKQNRRRLRQLQTKSMNRPTPALALNPTTAAGLEAAAEAAVTGSEGFSASTADYTVESKQLTFNANLSLAY